MAKLITPLLAALGPLKKAKAERARRGGRRAPPWPWCLGQLHVAVSVCPYNLDPARAYRHAVQFFTPFIGNANRAADIAAVSCKLCRNRGGVGLRPFHWRHPAPLSARPREGCLPKGRRADSTRCGRSTI